MVHRNLHEESKCHFAGLIEMVVVFAITTAVGVALMCSFGTGRIKGPPMLAIACRECSMIDGFGVPRGKWQIDTKTAAIFEMVTTSGTLGPWLQAGSESLVAGVRSAEEKRALGIDYSPHRGVSGLYFMRADGQGSMHVTTGPTANGLEVLNPIGGSRRWSLNFVDGYGTSARLFDDRLFDVWGVNRR